MTNPQLIELSELLTRVSRITQKDLILLVDCLEYGGVLTEKETDNIIDLAAHRKLTP
jgi:hypothetical protein